MGFRKFAWALLISAGIGGLFVAPSAIAGVVYQFGNVNSAADILNNGAVLEANHMGEVGSVPGVSVTVNGITFGTSTTGFTGMAHSGSDFSSQFTAGSAMDQLFSGAYYQTGTSSSLLLSGLTAGTDYLLQLLLANNVNATGTSADVTVQGDKHDLYGDFIQTVAYSQAHYLRVTFTADAATQLVQFGDGIYSFDSDRMHLNAYALSTATQVPEPGSLALFGLALAGLSMVSRRRKA